MQENKLTGQLNKANTELQSLRNSSEAKVHHRVLLIHSLTLFVVLNADPGPAA